MGYEKPQISEVGSVAALTLRLPPGPGGPGGPGRPGGPGGPKPPSHGVS